ncbi:MAG TPA: hypothetical protein VFH31_05450 [Pyrinomonadaceae bacterium]|nr:hypothetical protein [Pyrinomonadaceae bacterium]
MAGYERFTKGGRSFFRFGAYDVEEELALRGSMQQAGVDDNKPIYEFIEDEYETQQALSNIAKERSNRAAYAADQGLTTGAQTGYKNTRSRMGTSILTGGGRASGGALTRGRKASAILGS